MCLCVLEGVNFEDEIQLKGKNVKPEKNSIFHNRGKTVNSVENQKILDFR